MIFPSNMTKLRTVHQLYVLAITRVQHLIPPTTGPLGLPLMSMVLSTCNFVKLLAPLSLAPVLDCKGWRNCHIGALLVMDRFDRSVEFAAQPIKESLAINS